MIRIHKQGRTILLIYGIISIALSIILWFILPLFLFLIAVLIVAALTILVVRFFRIPSRIFIDHPEAIIAPADGKIVAIEDVFEKEYFKDNRKQISIFMSIYNVHINWYPITGVISYFKYHKGKYLVARHPKSSDENERTSIGIKNKNSEILVRQIAGFIARRIICNAETNNDVYQNEELGFIKFGSRLDVFLPPESEINVKIGDKTTGGKTILATFK